MNHLVSLPLCSILLALEPQMHTGVVRSAENELSARQKEARFSAEDRNMFPAVALPLSSVPSLSIAQAAGAQRFVNGVTNNAVVSGKRTAGMLRGISLSGWTREEAESNQRLFWERYQFEIQSAMVEYQIRIDSCEREIARNNHLQVSDDDKIAKCDESLKKIQNLIRANRFPANLDGEIMSKQELQDIRAAYETLRTQTLEHMRQYEDQILANETLLLRLRSEILKKKAELKTVEALIGRSDSQGKTPDFGTILSGLSAGKTLTEIMDDPSTKSDHGANANAPGKTPVQGASGMTDKEKSK